MTKKKLANLLLQNLAKLHTQNYPMIQLHREMTLPVNIQKSEDLSVERFEHTLIRAIRKHFDYCAYSGGWIVNGIELQSTFYVAFPHYPNSNGIENPLDNDELNIFIDDLSSYLNQHIGYLKKIELWSASSNGRDFGLWISIVAPSNKYRKG